jgi:hypothetical protein
MNWRRLLGEAVLVIVSVYVAIVLEGMSADRAQASDATDALAQLLEELREDRQDMAEALEQQEAQGGRYADLRRWFAAPSSMPQDSVGEVLDQVAYVNLTVYTRDSSWSMMVAGGTLSFVSDRALVTELGDLYENAYDRLEVISTRYDDAFFSLTEGSAWKLWDFENGRLLATDPRSIAVFRNELRSMDSWSQYYRDLLREYHEKTDALIVDLEEYLQARGRGT